MVPLLQFLGNLYPSTVHTLTTICNLNTYVTKPAHCAPSLPLSMAQYRPPFPMTCTTLNLSLFVMMLTAHPFNVPFKVIEIGPKTFLVDIGGKTETVSVDRLKPTHLDLEHPDRVAVPRRRGRHSTAFT